MTDPFAEPRYPAVSFCEIGTYIAEIMGVKDRVGSIDRGKFADVIAVAGDPVADITELKRVKFVMKGGKIIRNELTSRIAK